jgi:hypothetical protein
MSSSGVDLESELDVRATGVIVTDDTLTVDLEDGRTIVAPVAWFPRLKHGTPAERANLEISASGIHWPDLDEDINIRGLLLGRKSGENPQIIKWWLDQRAKGRKTTLEDYMREKHKASATSRKHGRKAG